MVGKVKHFVIAITSAYNVYSVIFRALVKQRIPYRQQSFQINRKEHPNFLLELLATCDKKRLTICTEMNPQ